MLQKLHVNEEINAQMLVPKHRLKDAAYLVGDTGVPARQAIPPEDPPGIPFGYTNSLEDLIKDGRKFATIYATPPWPCDLAPEPGSFYYRKPVTGDVLAALPVPLLTAPSARAYLWAPDQFLLDAIRVLDAWGFIYVGSLVAMFPGIKVGDDLGAVHQFLLHGVHRDSPSLRHQPGWSGETRHLVAPGIMPSNVKSLVQEVSPYPRLHLFNGNVSKGWTSWGLFPQHFDPDEEDDWGPDEDDDRDDERCESEPYAECDGLVADSPIFLDAAAEKSTRRVDS